MNVIYKYELSGDTVQTVSLPINSIILSVVEQHQKIVVYALVDTKQGGLIQAQFLLLGTGQNFNNAIESYSFLNTVKLSNGDIMVHVFVEKGWGLI